MENGARVSAGTIIRRTGGRIKAVAGAFSVEPAETGTGHPKGISDKSTLQQAGVLPEEMFDDYEPLPARRK